MTQPQPQPKVEQLMQDAIASAQQKIPPPQKSEKMFRKYEKHIHTILLNYPTSTTFFPTDVALSTFSCRLRDAINSVIEYSWSTALDVSRLKEIWSKDLEVVIQEGPSAVIARKRVSADSKVHNAVSTSQPLAQSTESGFVCEVDNPPRAVAHSLAILYRAGLLTIPSKLSNLTPELSKELQTTYGDSITLVESDTIPNTFTIL